MHILADAGADFNITDPVGRTPLDYALHDAEEITPTRLIFGEKHIKNIINFLRDKTKTNDQ